MFFSDAKQWGEQWAEVKDAGKIEAGGQGSAKIVRRCGGDGTVYFLKILSRQDDPERRERMYREVACYQLLDHPGIPTLIESNSNHYNDKSYKLYLVTEYIQGTCLENVGVPVSADEAIPASLRLCSILRYAHSKTVVYRDIKPSNIIVRQDNLSDVVLVDFGMSYYEEASADVTPTDKEVGNRFLRLQELACESVLKRDPRSDVTFCCGILFFLLTGMRPAQLIDHAGRMPHQRPEVVNKIASIAGLDVDQVLALFDRAFDFRIDHRFQNADALADAIRACVIRDQEAKRMDIDAMAERIKARVTAPAEVAIREKMDLLAEIIKLVENTTHHVGSKLGGAFGLFLTGYMAEPANLRICYTIGLVLQTNESVRFTPTYEARVAGNEIVLMAGQTPLYRCDSEKVGVTNLVYKIEKFIIENIDEITSRGKAGGS